VRVVETEVEVAVVDEKLKELNAIDELFPTAGS
jgi:hypothetical protein